MSREPEQQPRRSSDLTPSALAVAAFASVVATSVIGRFGLTGTVLGAALLPVLITIVRELAKAPAERMVRVQVPRLGGGRMRLPVRRPRWGVVATTSAAAFAIAVAVFTVPDLITGQSVVSDRPSTFFSRGAGTPAPEDPGAERPGPATTTEEEAPEPPPPATAGTTTAPPPETQTAPPATTAPAVPEAAPPPTTAPPAEPSHAPAPPGEHGSMTSRSGGGLRG